MTAFGLDIAGYMTGRSALARAVLRDDGSVDVTVFTDHIFAKKPQAGLFEDHFQEEVAALKACLSVGKVMVDCPIDLQGLPTPPRVEEMWQLALRPVDKAFNGLPPLAGWLAFPVARFQHLWSHLRCDDGDPLGATLFETYPAGSLRRLGLPYRKYKDEDGATACQSGRWGETVLGTIIEALGVEGEDGLCLTHDEVDAAICAITGILDAR